MTVYLLRHGQTPGNANRVVQTPDTPLSDLGVDQAARLAKRLADAGISDILASDLRRAAMTAEPLQAATRARLEHEPLLQERNFGDIRGTPYAEVGTDIMAPDYVPPGGESWDDLHARVDRAWDRIRRAAAAAEGHLAVVTHGLVCYSLVTRHLALPDPGAPIRFDNTSVTLVESGPPDRVVLFNCTAHLEGGPADISPFPSEV